MFLSSSSFSNSEIKRLKVSRFSRWLVVCLLACFAITKVSGQETRPRGGFERDSIKVGEVVPYTLSYIDRKNRAVIFPDSTYDFSPFELVNKAYFDTKSDTLNSIDSAVYFLTTFEIDTTQHLMLPVFLITDEDSLAVFSETDSIVLNQVVLQMPDSVDLLETAYYAPVATQFNYPVAGVVFIGILFLAGLVAIFFGKTIGKKIKLYRLRKRLEKFQLGFDEQIESLSNNPSKPQIEGVLKYWKIFMEGMEQLPYLKLTTREIILISQNKSLEETLKSIDKNIYSTVAVLALQNDFEFLKDYSLDRYNHITQEIKDA